jgi:hypothetical protein
MKRYPPWTSFQNTRDSSHCQGEDRLEHPPPTHYIIYEEVRYMPRGRGCLDRGFWREGYGFFQPLPIHIPVDVIRKEELKMPLLGGTGPMKLGPFTGGGRGVCNPYGAL